MLILKESDSHSTVFHFPKAKNVERLSFVTQIYVQGKAHIVVAFWCNCAWVFVARRSLIFVINDAGRNLLIWPDKLRTGKTMRCGSRRDFNAGQKADIMSCSSPEPI